MVCRVEPGSSAQRQGLREGDWILGVNNHVVEHEDYWMVRLGWNPGSTREHSVAPGGDRSLLVTSLGMWG